MNEWHFAKASVGFNPIETYRDLPDCMVALKRGENRLLGHPLSVATIFSLHSFQFYHAQLHGDCIEVATPASRAKD